MNYFAHAWLASRRGDDPRFALGAMLPDWVPWVGGRLERVDDPALALGVRFHHHSDAAFHAGARFSALVREAVEHLRAAGLERGPARGAAHVGIELLLDGALLAEPSGHAPYLAALAAAPAASRHLGWSRPESARRYERVVERLSEQGLPLAYTDSDQVAERIARTLEHRPRLRVHPGEAAALARWARDVQPEVNAAAGTLIAETEAGLSMRRDRAPAPPPRAP